MPNYERIKKSDPVVAILNDMVASYHGELKEAEVTVDMLWVRANADDNGDPVGPALKHNGYQAAAVVRIIGLKDRAKGNADAEIVLDGDRWEEWDDDQKAAIIDHELTHLELATDGDGNVKRDDLGRPKLRMRKHDHQFGWFDSVVRRHGVAAIEHQQAKSFFDDYKQLYLEFEPATA